MSADSIVTAINIHQIIECSSPSPATLFCLFRKFFSVFFALDHSPDSRMILNSTWLFTNCAVTILQFCCIAAFIVTTINIPHDEILRICHFLRIDVTRIVALIYHEVFLRTLRIARFRREEFLRDQVELFVPFSKKFYQVALNLVEIASPLQQSKL